MPEADSNKRAESNYRYFKIRLDESGVYAEKGESLRFEQETL